MKQGLARGIDPAMLWNQLGPSDIIGPKDNHDNGDDDDDDDDDDMIDVSVDR